LKKRLLLMRRCKGSKTNIKKKMQEMVMLVTTHFSLVLKLVLVFFIEG
jgi:hypothetical protein